MSLQEIYAELKKIREDVEYIKKILLQLELIDLTLTPEEGKLVKEAKEAIDKNDFSAFVNVDEL